MEQNERFAKFWNIKLASEGEIVRRTQICKACDRYMSITNMCKECGCYMPFKTKLRSMSCPLNHWVAETDATVNNGSSGDNNGDKHRSSTK